MIGRDVLEQHYLRDRMSMQEVATILGCSQHKVVYYMNKYEISRRSRSEAIYHKHNPAGDPFEIVPTLTLEQARLMGLGLGLYWGEGNKANKYSVRLGNTDPELIKVFVEFLVKLFSVKKESLRFGLQLFTDTDPVSALTFWTEQLAVKPSQFYRVTVTISGSIGTYRNKNQYGVVTVYYHNKKLRDILVGMLPR
jgi:hypothetical protein